MRKILPYILILVLILYLGLVYLMVKRKKLKSDNSKTIELFNKLYDKVKKVSFINKELQDIKSRLFLYIEKDEIILYTAVKIYLIKSLLLLMIFIVLCRIYLQDICSLCVVLLICFIMNNSLKELIIVDDLKISKKLINFIDNIKHSFHLYKMVEISILEASKFSDLSLQGKKIAKAISNKIELNTYLSTCPNKYLKTITSLSFLTKEYGDKKVKDMSLYIKNLCFIKDEIKLEWQIKDQLRYWIRTLGGIALCPLLFPSLLSNWMKNTIEQTKEYINGPFMYYSKFILIFIVIICYLIIRKYKTISDKKFVIQFDCWEQRLLDSMLGKYIKLLIPKENSKLHKNRLKLIKKSYSNVTVEWLYLRRGVLLILGFILSLGVFMSAHKMNKNIILTNSRYGLDSTEYAVLEMYSDRDNNVSRNETNTSKEKNNEDLEILKRLKTKDTSENNRGNMKSVVKSILSEKGYKLQALDIKTKQILNKYISFNNNYMKGYEILISLIISIFISYLPVLQIYLERNLIEAAMQNEVAQFNTIILILIHNENVSVELILRWMENFSMIFYEPIKKCLNGFQKNPQMALVNLKNEVHYTPFKNIADNLIVSYKNLTLVEAFESLENDREFYKLERLEENRRMVNKRVAKARRVAFIPVYLFLILYLLAPIIVTGFNELKKLSSIIPM